MPLNASKYKDFTINAEDWVESESIYTWTVIANTVTENDAIITLNISADSQGYLMAPLDWETGANFVKLSTSTKPTGTIKGYFITLPVTVI